MLCNMPVNETILLIMSVNYLFIFEILTNMRLTVQGEGANQTTKPVLSNCCFQCGRRRKQGSQFHDLRR